MLICADGDIGGGKTLFITWFPRILAFKLELPLFANFTLKGSKRVKSWSELLALRKCIICLTEFWEDVDSRLSRSGNANVLETRWINQTRHKDILVFMDTQSFGQLDLRVRNATDIIVYCRQFNTFYQYAFINHRTGIIYKVFKLDKNSANTFYGWYDSWEDIIPLKKDFKEKIDTYYGFKKNKGV